MRKWIVLTLLLGVLFVALAALTGGSALASLVGGSTYTEHFTSTLYLDAAHTTAVWDTAAGQLRLHTLPRMEGRVGQLYYATAWSAAAYVSETGRVYLFGGTGNSWAIQEYDPATNSCFKLPLMLPYRLSGAAAVYAPTHDAVYLLGGASRTDIAVLDMSQTPFTVTVLTNKLPRPLFDAATVYVPQRDKAYLFGGIDPDRLSYNTILEFDLSSGTVITLPVTFPISFTKASAVYDPVTDSAYIFGGQLSNFETWDTYPQDSIFKFDIAQQTVTTVGTLPMKVSATTAVCAPDQRKAYVFGGLGETAPMTRTVEFDIASGTITWLDENPLLARMGAAAVYVPTQAKAYILGGLAGYTSLPDVLTFDVNTKAITQTSIGLDGRAGASVIYAPSAHKVYFFGGQSVYEAASQSIVSYDVDQVELSLLPATLPVSRTDTAAVYVPATNRAYIFGGRQPDETTQYFSDILRFNVATEQLSTVSATLPTGRAGIAAVYVPGKGKAYLFGGFDGSKCLDQILAYNPAQEATAPVALEAKLPITIAYTSAVYDATTNKVYLFGGWNPDVLGEYTDRIIAFDVEQETAALLTAKLPRRRAKAATIAIPGEARAYVLGGASFWPNLNLDDLVQFDTVTGVITTLQGIKLGVPRTSAAVYLPEKSGIYLFGGVGYVADIPLGDITMWQLGYAASETAQSLKVNAGDGEVRQALLSVEQALHSGSVSYSLSNDGGQTWASVQPGVQHVFSAPGSDLHWRAALSGNGTSTPLVDSLTITYGGFDHRVLLPMIVKAGY